MKDGATIVDQAMIEQMIANSPFHQLLKVELIDVGREEGRVAIRLPYRQDYQRTPGSGRYHGGVIAAFVDLAGTFAMIAKASRNTPTVGLTIDYLRAPEAASDLIATAVVRKFGRSVGISDVEVTDGAGNLAALGRVQSSTTEREA